MEQEVCQLLSRHSKTAGPYWGRAFSTDSLRAVHSSRTLSSLQQVRLKHPKKNSVPCAINCLEQHHIPPKPPQPHQPPPSPLCAILFFSTFRSFFICSSLTSLISVAIGVSAFLIMSSRTKISANFWISQKK